MLKRRAFGTYAIAKICHVAPITVGRWIEEGKLPFFTTGGGHRRVWDTDLAAFLKAHNYPAPPNLLSNLNPTVLIVEDNTVTRRLIRRTLEQFVPKFTIREAADGFEAGEMISKTLPNLIVLDIWLPGINGIEICKKIRQDKARKNLKILAINGDASNDTKKKVMKAGADAFLAKPFKAEALLKMVEKLANRPAQTNL